MAKIAARYIGDYPVVLKEGQGRLYDGDGNPLTSNLLNPGQTLMMNDTEVLGQTYKRPTRGQGEATFLGVGRVILPEHASRTAEELDLLGYEFHEGRSDFVEEKAPTAQDTSSKGRRSSASSLPTSTTSEA